jgi:hypothetical protein
LVVRDVDPHLLVVGGFVCGVGGGEDGDDVAARVRSATFTP